MTKKKITHKKVLPKKDTKKSASFKFEYAESLESTKILQIEKSYDLFINGKFITPKSGKYFESINPSNGTVLTHLSEANEKDVDSAVQSAQRAYDNVWSKMSGSQRGRFLYRIARILQERAREFAVLETLDGGKPIKESRDVDIPLAAAHFFYYAGWADKLNYICPPLKSPQSLGVVAAIIPWNFPLLMAAWKIAPALAAGNTVVLKPAEQTSLTALLLAQVFQEAELPEGVVNIVTGAGSTGAALVAHPLTKKIAFTGSTDIGKKIASVVATTDKKLTLELGGKSAQIIFEDAAIDQAVEGIVQGIFFNQGHVCCAGSRLLVEESISDLVIRKLKKRMESIRVGNPLDKNTDIGAINSKEQLEKIQNLVSLGKKEGAKYFETSCSLPSKGFYHRPCIFTHTSVNMSINQVEIFGPVLSIQSFRTPDEAIKKANDTPYGLAAGIWSEKSSKIHNTSRQLKAGVIWCNTYNKFDPCSPFGGYKESGYGREGGILGLLPYLNFKDTV